MDCSSLKVGDKVIKYYYYQPREVTTITKITKTQLTTALGEKFRIKDGRLIGGTVEGCCIKPYTKEVQREIEKADMLRQINIFNNWKYLSYEDVETVYTIIKKGK